MKEADLLKQLQRVRLTFKTFTTQMIPTTLSVTVMAAEDVDEVGRDVAGGFTALVTPALV